MHTVEMLDAALALAKECGFLVRQDWLAGTPAGTCQFKGRRWLIVDMSQSPRDQLDAVLAALAELPQIPQASANPALQSLLRMRSAGIRRRGNHHDTKNTKKER